jgi:hypothetical protein
MMPMLIVRLTWRSPWQVLLTRADYIGPRAERSIWALDLSSRLRRRYAEV